MLKVSQLHAYYGKSHILQGVDLHVGEGEIVGLLGRNGAGKTTTLASIAGLMRGSKGSIVLGTESILQLPAYQIAQRGISLVPEHRGIFKTLSVLENLQIAERPGSKWNLADIFGMFPRLSERQRNGGAELSGGEQQMLAIARALLNNPRVLLLDEPTEGLAPVIVDELRRVVRMVRDAGVPVLLVEQNLTFCMDLADRHYILEQGAIVQEIHRQAFGAERAVYEHYLSV